MKSILTIVGTRPQFIKAAALSRVMKNHARFNERMIHTGQHFDPSMSEAFFTELEIPSSILNLNIHGGSHGEMTGAMLTALENAMTHERPDGVLVYGDTNSTLAGALAAAKLSIPIFHVEAGLRSFNRSMPEEINRVLTDHLSSTLFCPTSTAVQNLKNEGIVKGVHDVGDVMYDIALHAGSRSSTLTEITEKFGLKHGEYALATAHRAENTDSPDALARVIGYLKKQSNAGPVIFPLHPRTKAAIKRDGLDLDPLIICDPVGYLEMVSLIKGARMILTDSGGLQKEAYFHGVPCVTMRKETEWVETIEAGWNRLWTESEYRPRKKINEYGDGHAAEKIMEIINSN